MLTGGLSRIVPDDFTLYNNMAECLRRVGALAEALEALNRADRLLPRYATVAVNRAALMAELGGRMTPCWCLSRWFKRGRRTRICT